MLFIHGINPVFELPASLGFAEALANSPDRHLLCFLPRRDLPARPITSSPTTPVSNPGATRRSSPAATGRSSRARSRWWCLFTTPKPLRMSCWQPFSPSAEALAAAVPYKDEVEFLQNSVQRSAPAAGLFQCPGDPILLGAVAAIRRLVERHRRSGRPIRARHPRASHCRLPSPEFDGEGDYYLFPFPSPILERWLGSQ